MKFCSECGSEKIEFIVPQGDNQKRLVCSSCTTIHYSNPRIIVGILATYNNKVLLCRRNIEPRKNLWNLPAGFLENGETAEDGAKRETLEEANATVEIQKLHCIYSIPNANQVYLHFLAKMEKPEYSVTSESSEVGLFSESEIPWDELAFSSTEFALKKYFENPDHPGTHVGHILKIY